MVGISTSSVAEDDLEVVTSIKPLHSIVSAVMASVGEPKLVISGSESPHTHILRPSNMRMLQNATIVFLIDETCEASMGAATKSLDEDIDVIELMKIDNIDLVQWADASARLEAQEEHEDENKAESLREMSMFDHHIWLDPMNAIVMAKEVARVLSLHAEEHSEVFSNNADNLIAKIERPSQTVTD